MEKYTAINIGPIFKTLNMARKPRGLWAASYLFSLLMKCIIEQIPKEKIISPAVSDEEVTEVGLYPDRLFIKGNINIDVIDKAVKEFAKLTKLSENVVREYFNLMHVTIDNDNNVPEAIKTLNNKLDCMELFERAVDSDYEQKIIELISQKDNSPLFDVAFKKTHYPVNELKTIASNGRDDKKSYNEYFCIVQADGDNMGKIISSQNTNVGEVSRALLEFGKNAVEMIKSFSKYSLPIYAGGDDLLFIVPVVGNNGRNVIDLLEEIDKIYAENVKSVADNIDTKTTMSYGVAICYYKYPLYEAFDTARKQLFGIAKNLAGKNALAIDLRKHSGGAFSINFSKNNTNLYEGFKDMINASDKVNSEAVVSAVSHKIRENDGLLELWVESKDNYKARNLNFFKKYMEYTVGDKYKDAALDLLNALFANAPSKVTLKDKQTEEAAKTEWIVRNMYGMLRMAKFMKGEEHND